MIASTLATAVLVINELMASNAGMVMSPASNFDSWIELYNPGNQAVSLSGMYLSNDAANLKLWRIPSAVGSVPAKGHKVVWLGSNDIKTTQAPFHLDSDGGTIYLSDTTGELLLSQTYPEALSRTAWARKSDGGDEWGWTDMATPGATNATASFATERLDAPVVSAGSCLFKSTQKVSVTIPDGTTLRYTTDGSLPTAASSKSQDGQFSFTKTTALTVRLFRDGFLPSVPVTRSYIKTNNQYTLPIVSIVGDKKYFTDPKTGIDCDGDGTNGKTGNGQNWPKNYNQDWDRPVNFSYMSPEGEMLFNQDVNISVSGGWTRSQRFRSFKLKSNKVFDGQNRFDYSFFPQKPYIRNKTVVVRNGGNDVWNFNARLTDAALQTIIFRSGIDIDVQSYVPVIEYVNGELRGVLNLREPNNDKFAYANWGYDDEELDDFENFKMKNGTDEVLKRIFELGKSINEDSAYEELKTLLDIDEFTNYMAIELFLDNDDWPDNNVKAYRSQHDGRYRFITFDLDFAFGKRGMSTGDNPFNYIGKFRNTDFIEFFYNLLKRDDYRRKFIDTFCVVAGSVFEPTRSNAIIDELLDAVQPMCQLMRQQGINDGHEPKRAADNMKNKLKSRSSAMTNHMKQFAQAQLSGITRQSVNLTTDTEGALLFINGINVPYSAFNGHLFAPVTLKAEAPAGYRFAGWKQNGSIVGTNEQMDLPQGTSISIVATFTPMGDAELAEAPLAPVRINEVSANNGIYVNDFFKRNDWVELYNTTSEPIDVAGMYLSDNVDKPQKYQIPSTHIPAHGYLIVWCDKLEPLNPLHASFKLAEEGGDVLLTAADGSWSDHFVYGAMKSDETAGRYPDGTDNVFTMNVPTIARANMLTSYAVSIAQPATDGISDLTLSTAFNARYHAGKIIVSGAADGPVSVTIVNMAGQHRATLNSTVSDGRAVVNIGQLHPGTYVAVVTDANGRRATCKLSVFTNRI